MKTKTINDTSTLANICQVATERFRENAKMMTKVAATGGNGLVSVDAAKALAKQFEVQAREAQLFGYILNDCDALTIQFETADWEEEDIVEAMKV
jgi:formylmethanofuran dehydrogenase subunit B